MKSAAMAADLVLPPMPGPRILIYHRVTPEPAGLELEVTPRAFTQHLDHLAARFEVMGLGEAIQRRNDPSATNLVVLTFDDGYRDIHRHAFPELRERGLPFVLYLATETIETQRPLFGREEAPPLDWEQIAEMRDTGLVEIGAHTHRHPDLREATRSQVEDEVAVSNALIEERLGVRPVHFAYPWGYWGREADPVIRETYASAVLGSGPGKAGLTDPHLLHRVPVQLSDAMVFFRRKVQTGLLAEDWIRRRIRGYTGP